MKHFYENISGWFNYQELYSKVVKDLPNNSHIVEVGAWKGCSTSYMAVEIINSNKNIKFDVVDTWRGSPTEEGHMKDEDLIKYNGDIFKLFLKNMEPVIKIINPLQMTSLEASKLYKDESLDFVFLDAAHTYQDVKDDLHAWFPKVKKGGIFAGHDMNPISWPGVVQAVNEKVGKDNYQVIGESWMTVKA